MVRNAQPWTKDTGVTKAKEAEKKGLTVDSKGAGGRLAHTQLVGRLAPIGA